MPSYDTPSYDMLQRFAIKTASQSMRLSHRNFGLFSGVLLKEQNAEFSSGDLNEL